MQFCRIFYCSQRIYNWWRFWTKNLSEWVTMALFVVQLLGTIWNPQFMRSCCPWEDIHESPLWIESYLGLPWNVVIKHYNLRDRACLHKNWKFHFSIWWLFLLRLKNPMGWVPSLSFLFVHDFDLSFSVTEILQLGLLLIKY